MKTKHYKIIFRVKQLSINCITGIIYKHDGDSFYDPTNIHIKITYRNNRGFQLDELRDAIKYGWLTTTICEIEPVTSERWNGTIHDKFMVIADHRNERP